jgi:hypothetical protein
MTAKQHNAVHHAHVTDHLAKARAARLALREAHHAAAIIAAEHRAETPAAVPLPQPETR